MNITRNEFDLLEKTLIYSRRSGRGPMNINANDLYVSADGRLIVHSFGMGGESFAVLMQFGDTVPGGAPLDE